MVSAVLQDRLERCRTLPTLPAVALHVVRLCERPNFDLQDMARAVSSDPVLAAKVLRLVNSAAFGIKREVTAIQQALMFLGAKAVRNVALSFALVKDVRDAEKPGFDYEAYWRRSLVCAVAARELAKLAGLPRTEEPFLAALTQDIGMLALAQIEPAYGEFLLANNGPHDALLEKEKAQFGDSHASVSRWLLKRWRLPSEIQALAAQTHPLEAPPPPKGEEKSSRVMSLSGPAADVWLASDGALAARAFAGLADEVLGLDVKALETLFAAIASSLQEAASLFDISVGSKEEVETTLQRVVVGLRPGEIDSFDPVAAAQKASQPLVDPDDPLGEELRNELLVHYEEPALERALLMMVEESARASKVLSVVLVDIDGFARVNTNLGRAVGDRLLKVLGHWFKMRLRGRDVCVRFEGAAFVLVLVETPLAGADLVAERLRRQLGEAAFEVGAGRSVSVTATFGCAAMANDANSPRTLMAKAIQALRLSKTTRRIRTSSIPAPPRRGVA
ncbi:MAG: GGDEF domain-containing protein [Deltaproteobacteria bacterium]|nr:GGDEF domain-containing protein [Deltaproteobacteria bacterium]